MAAGLAVAPPSVSSFIPVSLRDSVSPHPDAWDRTSRGGVAARSLSGRSRGVGSGASCAAARLRGWPRSRLARRDLGPVPRGPGPAHRAAPSWCSRESGSSSSAGIVLISRARAPSGRSAQLPAPRRFRAASGEPGTGVLSASPPARPRHAAGSAAASASCCRLSRGKSSTIVGWCWGRGVRGKGPPALLLGTLTHGGSVPRVCPLHVSGTAQRNVLPTLFHRPGLLPPLETLTHPRLI